jgi:hypothetical protein
MVGFLGLSHLLLQPGDTLELDIMEDVLLTAFLPSLGPAQGELFGAVFS